MRFPRPWKAILTAALLAAALPSASLAQRVGYTKEELVRRRAALAERTREGMIILFGEALPQPGAHFRQDNDFFYLCGVEDLNAVLVLNAKTKEAHLFLTRQMTRDEGLDGGSILRDPRTRESLGLTSILDLSYFDEFVARNAAAFAVTWLRLGSADSVAYDRTETASLAARRDRLQYNAAPLPDDYRAARFRERHPAIEVRDVTPHLDALRQIKSAEEAAILRRGGRLSAEAVKLAMATCRPGVFEYELEAAALQVILTGGARGPAAAPVVASGPNSCLPRYDKNMRRAGDGDLLVMDFGTDLDHLAMTCARTWPVNGKFTKEQREIYEIVLTVEKACLEAFRPGATQEDVTRAVDRALKKKGLNGRGLVGDMGHFVGLSVHDVGPKGKPFREGMVYAVDPAIYIAERNLGVRIADTVLITRTGCEVLTKNAPKEIEEIERLTGRNPADDDKLTKGRGIL